MLHQMCGVVPLSWVHEARRELNSMNSLKEVAARAPKLVPAFRFLHHERHAHISQAGAFHLKKNGKKHRLDGLTSQLKEVFHPFSLDISTGGQKTGGAARGTEVDSEITSLVDHGRIPTRLGPDGAPLPPSLNEFTKRVLEKLYEENLKPFMTQVSVYDDALCLATRLDMVCIDMSIDLREHSSNLVNVQLKTGFDKNYDRKGEFFHSPEAPNSLLTRIHQSYANLHQLQVTMEHTLLQTRYGRPMNRSIILLVTSLEASIVELSSVFTKTLIRDIYHNLAARKNKPKWERASAAVKASEAYKKAKKEMKI